ncbi:MAG: 3-methyl-2-oxobutanoate hydroxymethyltransferase, partial [Acidimicrobiales bacterium]
VCSGRARIFTPPGAAASGNGRVGWDLDEVVKGADLVVLVASSDEASGFARTLGELCDKARVMTAGVVIGRPDTAGAVVSALRAHARMLLVSDTPGDLADILTALRA